ncbi:MAG TPA: OmpH family outer membrane protein [Desulfomonilia bacterium]|jgi:outer membrane protein|nr:OmpH family outer membrane protein [Thermodesulfobacteriota bacterium]HWR68153.1 OmpH family outer membrane protein [Desulfomonilia bacterium]
MNRFIAALCATCLMFAVAGKASAEDLKIVYIDSQKVITESLVGKEAFAKLKALSDQKETDLKKRETKIKGISDQIQAKSATMSASAKEDLQKQYEKEVKEYNRTYKDAQDELRNEEMKILKPWTKDLEEIIKNYGQKNKIDLILDRTNPVVIYGSDKIDVTKAILEIFNKNYQEKQSKQKKE